jgi:hypothetical protein
MAFSKHHVLKLAPLFISIIEDILLITGQDDGTVTSAKPTN